LHSQKPCRHRAPAHRKENELAAAIGFSFRWTPKQIDNCPSLHWGQWPGFRLAHCICRRPVSVGRARTMRHSPHETPADVRAPICHGWSTNRFPGARLFVRRAFVFVSPLQLANLQSRGRARSTITNLRGRTPLAQLTLPGCARAGSFVARFARSSWSSLQTKLRVIVRQNPRRLHVEVEILQIRVLFDLLRELIR